MLVTYTNRKKRDLHTLSDNDQDRKIPLLLCEGMCKRHALWNRPPRLRNQREAKGDVMAESRGGKEDMRLKKSFVGLWNEGTEYMSQERFHEVFTSKQLKVKPKANNISGLQLADLIAHPSRNEILKENELLERPLPLFGTKVIEILQRKYYQHGGRIFGKKFI